MSSTSTPRFRSLDRSEIDAILARNHVGRLAYTRDDRIEIQPVHYVYADGWLYGRTSRGAKSQALGDTAYQWWPVAFEVDEIDGLFEWRSVVVHGGFYVVPSESDLPWQEEEREQIVERLRSLIPETFRGDDPTPFRTILFRIAVQDVTGREAQPSSEDGDT